MKTVLVIGAGALYDMGMPTGRELVEDIVQLARNDRTISGRPHEDIQKTFRFSALGDLSYDDTKNERSKIRQTVWLSSSIDNFVQEQNDLKIKKMSKALIEVVLLFRTVLRLG